jgi:hypothetical protein
MSMQLRDPLSEVSPEERIEAMRDELADLEDAIPRERAALEIRRRAGGPGPRRGRLMIESKEEKLAEMEARANELFGALNACAIGDTIAPPSGYVFCRACNAQTGREAHFERAGLCTSCFFTATNPTPERGQP